MAAFTKKRGTLVELALIVVVAIGLAMAVQAWAVKPYQIPSPSMEPTLDIGQRVLVNRIGNNFGDPQIGDIVVFHPPVGAIQPPRCGVEPGQGEACSQPVPQEYEDKPFIKRVVAGPGDRLRIEEGHPVVNGVRAEESFARACNDPGSCDFPVEITIPEDHYFMMGDNRPSSDDSRFWGPVPRDWIIGEAVVTYWPPDRIGIF
jgi:signal peptidase I